MKRNLIVILVLVVTNIPLGCDNETDCGPFPTLEGTIESLGGAVGSYLDSFTPANSQGYTTAAIQVLIESMDYQEVSHLNPVFNFTHAAYACSPIEPQPTQAIERIIITSSASVFFNEIEYPAGVDLTEFFKVSSYDYRDEERTISEFIEIQKMDMWFFGYEGANVIFQLVDQPTLSINQPFSFRFEFSDAAVIEVETDDFVVDA